MNLIMYVEIAYNLIFKIEIIPNPKERIPIDLVDYLWIT